jgi:glycosyltransferase involved in cell wall biosynthesis
MKVSVITIAYNSAKTLGETIESVNSQSYSEIEHILIDGKSSDETINIFKHKAHRNAQWISEKDEGIYDAMNKGLKLASGDIIGFLNSDDSFMHKDVIATIVTAFKDGADIVHGNLVFINEKGKVRRVWNSESFQPSDFLKSNSPAHPTLYCKKSILKSLNGFDVNFKIAGDIDFMIRAVLVDKWELHFLNEYLVKMKLGGASTKSLKSLIVITLEVWKSFEKNNISYSKKRYLIGKLKKAIKQTLL